MVEARTAEPTISELNALDRERELERDDAEVARWEAEQEYFEGGRERRQGLEYCPVAGDFK